MFSFSLPILMHHNNLTIYSPSLAVFRFPALYVFVFFFCPCDMRATVGGSNAPRCWFEKYRIGQGEENTGETINT